MSSRVVVVANQKGGVGKTVTAVSLAAFAAAKGLRILLLDADPQGHAGLALGVVADEAGGTASVIAGTTLADAARSSGIERLDVIPADLRLEAAGRRADELWLARALARDRGRWDIVLVDTGPGLGPHTRAALLAADQVISPVAGGVLGVISTARWIAAATHELARIEIPLPVRCVMTRFKRGQNTSRDAKSALAEAGLPTYDVQIREAVVVERSFMEQTPLNKLKGAGGLAKDYAKLTDELLAEVRNAA